MVFQNGGVIKQNEKFWYHGSKLNYSSYHKYLGLNISTRGTWSKATEMSAQAGKALDIMNKLRTNCNIPFDTTCNIFDKVIVPHSS